MLRSDAQRWIRAARELHVEGRQLVYSALASPLQARRDLLRQAAEKWFIAADALEAANRWRSAEVVRHWATIADRGYAQDLAAVVANMFRVQHNGGVTRI